MYRLLLVLTILGYIMPANGQVHRGNISGVVIDSAMQIPLEYVSAALYRASDSTLVNGTITNPQGAFVLNSIPLGSYFLKVSFVGFRTETILINTSAANSKWKDTLQLHRTSQYLESVKVTSELWEKLVAFEMTTIRVWQIADAVSGNLTEVLRNHSSVTFDATNKLSIRGNPNVLILIDGRPTSVEAFGSIPASAVETIEIITNPNVKYDAEGTGGILNIVLKPESRTGLSGNASVNLGIHGKVNGGVNLLMRKKKGSISIQYNGKQEKELIISSLERSILENPISIRQEIISNQVNISQMAAMEGTIRISPKRQLSGGIRILLPTQDNHQNLYSREISEDADFITLHRKNLISFQRKVAEGTLSYRSVRTPGKNELTFDLLYSRTRGSKPSEYYLENILTARSEGGGSPTLFSVQGDYLKAIGAFGLMEAGAKYYTRWNTFQYFFYDADSGSGELILNPTFSNDLTHSEQIVAGYLMFGKYIGSKMHAKGGVRVEYNASELIQKSLGDTLKDEAWIPFPFFMLKYILNPQHQFALSVNRRVTRPTYPQLNPWISVIDPMTYETGNKYLKPELLDKFEITHLFSVPDIRISSSLFFSLTKDFITQATTLPSADKLVVTYVNGEQEKRAGVETSWKVNLNPFFTLAGNATWYHLASTGLHDGTDLTARGPAWNCNLRMIFKPDPETTLQLSGYYYSPRSLPQFDLEQIYFFHYSLERSIFHKAATLSILITDLLNSNVWVISTQNDLYRLKNNSHPGAKVFWIGFSYNLNAFKPLQTKQIQEREADRSLIRIGM